MLRVNEHSKLKIIYLDYYQLVMLQIASMKTQSSEYSLLVLKVYRNMSQIKITFNTPQFNLWKVTHLMTMYSVRTFKHDIESIYCIHFFLCFRELYQSVNFLRQQIAQIPCHCTLILYFLNNLQFTFIFVRGNHSALNPS